MAKTKYYAELSESERSLLTRILCEGKVPDRTLMRAKILLMSDEAQKEKVSIRELAERLRRGGWVYPPHFSLGKCIFVILFFTIYIFYATLLCGGELPLLK